MASIIRIKRSEVSGNPTTLAAGELAYSALPAVGGAVSSGDRLYIGIGTETSGNAANHVVIGGKYFTDKLDHTPGTLTASSAIIVDGDSKINNLKVDNLDFDGNTITSTDLNGNLILTPNGTGSIVLDGQNWPQADGLANQYLKTNGSGQLQWAAIPSGSFDIVGNTGTDTFTTGGTLTITGTGPLSAAVTNDAVTLSAADATTTSKGVASFNSTDFSVSSGAVTLNAERIEDIVGLMVDTSGASGSVQTGISVTYNDTNGKLDFNVNDPTLTIAGDASGSATMTNLGNTTINVALATVNTSSGVPGSFGSSSAIPVLTVNAKGLVTAISTAAISSSFTIAGDGGTPTVFSNGGTLTFAGGEGIDTTITGDTVTIAAELATDTNKGVASFNTSGFVVTSGDVALKGNVVQGITTDTGALTPASNAISILGGEGIDVTHSGTTIYVAGELATTTNLGIASFNSASFSVTDGAVSVKTGGISNSQLANSSVTIGSSSVSLGSTITSLAGLTELAVDNINVNGNTISATDTNGNITLAPNGTGTVDASGKRITGVAAPVNDTDAANKGYVDNAITGLSFKEAVHLLAATNVALTGATTTLVIDGHAALDQTDSGYRILLKGQTTPSQNGIYVYNDNGTTYTLTRAADADAFGELVGASVFVLEGSTYANTGWVQSQHYLTDFSGQSWVQFSGAGTYTAGSGLTLSGNQFAVTLASGDGLEFSGSNAIQLKSTIAGNGLTYGSGVLAVVGTANRITANADSIDIASTYAGQTSIVTLGTVTTGTWNATAIGTTKGGTGLTSYATGDLVYASGTNTLTKLAKPSTETSLLTMASNGTPAWAALSNTGITGLGTVTTGTWNATTIATTKGGTGLTSYTTGDLLYASTTNTLAALAAGTDGQILQINSSGVPVWGDIDGGTY